MIHPVAYAPSQDFGDNPTAHLPANHWIIQQFGNYQPDGHTGIDYPCPVGTPVRAASDGVVRHVGWMGGGYADNPWWIAPSFAGFVYVVDHGHFIGIYGHCQDGGAKVRVGQQVSEGQVLGLSGNTGASTGPHLHFEVLPDGYILNSAMYGRINPTSLFRGSLTPQSGMTITPIKEDTLSAAEVKEIKDHINAVLIGGYEWQGKKHPGIGMVVEEEQRRATQTPARTAAAVWGTRVNRTGGKVSALQELADTKTKLLGLEPVVAQILENTSAEDVAAQIPDDIAQQVIDALAARLAGGK